MTENMDRKLPVGVQSFEKIRKEGYLYVDKTDIVWKLANRGKTYNYLSRPRRFGKSLLVDTLQSYFEGKNRSSYLSTNTTRPCNTLGKLPSTKHARPSTKRFSRYSSAKTNTRSSCSSQASPSLRRFPYSPYSTI